MHYFASTQPLQGVEETRKESEFGTIERRDRLASEEFFEAYVAESVPVVLSGAIADCTALKWWTLDNLRRAAGHRVVRLKEGYLSRLTTSQMPLRHYLDSIEQYERKLRSAEAPGDRPAYLHDIPLADIIEDIDADLAAFPSEFLPAWYRTDWRRFAQFFLGPSHSETPLHFDTLLTHNLFFQVVGRKRFILLMSNDQKYCYRYQWRWFDVNPESPDYSRHPLYRKTRPLKCIVGPGDMLYLPPGTLHHVRSLDCAISFNVDWHTRRSALKGVLACLQGMPRESVYYNMVLAAGLWTRIPTRRVLPFYRSYLNYVS